MLWRRFLLVGVLVAVGQVLLPVGPGRDVVYGATVAAGVGAMVVGIRRNRPAKGRAWWLVAAGLGATGVGDVVTLLVTGLGPPSTAVVAIGAVPYLVGYPLLATGVVMAVQSRVRERWPTALVDSAILTIGVGVLPWVLLVEPAISANSGPVLLRLVGIAYPLGDGLVFAMLIRLATAPGARNAAIGLLLGSGAALLAADLLAQFAKLAPALEVWVPLFDGLWLLSYILAGAAGLHPSIGELAASPPERIELIRPWRLVALTGAVVVGPGIIAVQVMVGAALSSWTVLTATTALVCLVGVRVYRIVRRLQQQGELLSRLADTDFVTGLANRRRFAASIDSLLADPHVPAASLVLVDVGRFPEVSEILGRRTADAILHVVGARLTELAGDGGVLARLGPHRFGILDPSITSADAVDAAMVRIRAAFERPLDLPELSLGVDLVVGALLLPAQATDLELALHRGDIALAAAKGRASRTARYDAELEAGTARAPVHVDDLRAALEQGEIVVHFQPQVDLATGRVFGVETLVRWQHPQHGLLAPDLFVPIAESSGLIGPLTRYVLDRALQQSARWQREGLSLTVAVNLSVLDLLAPDLVAQVRAGLARHGVRPESLELEITETTAMVDPRRSVAVLGALAGLGVTLSIDDYGTGHSSLSYLQRLPVRRLKIDRSFVAAILDDAASAAIVRSTLELAANLQLEVVAEGVEDDATLLALRAMGCFAVQGFGLGRPVAGPLVGELVARIEARLTPVLGIRSTTAGRTAI